MKFSDQSFGYGSFCYKSIPCQITLSLGNRRAACEGFFKKNCDIGGVVIIHKKI
jgi:hypothetical protein